MKRCTDSTHYNFVSTYYIYGTCNGPALMGIIEKLKNTRELYIDIFD